MPVVGPLAYALMHSLKVGVKDAVSPQVMFTDLGLKYVGPVDGHDEHAVEDALRRARGYGGPVIVHVITRKGMGYAPPRTTRPSRCIPPASSTRKPVGLLRLRLRVGLRCSPMRSSMWPVSIAISWRSPRHAGPDRAQ